MKNRIHKLLISVLAAFFLLGIIYIPESEAAQYSKETKPGKQPNIIIIMADDMGYSDPSCYGGEINTPAIDQLANEGLRLTHFHNCGMCVTTRSSMMTGNYSPYALPNFKDLKILPEALKESGYRTALIGKWHLPGNPMDRGFDHFFGFLGGFSNHFTGSADYRLDNEVFTDFGPDYYSSDAFADRAIDFVQSSHENNDEKPFFLFLSFQAPHNPLQAPREDIMKHRGKYLRGWQSVREARFQKQKELGIIPPDAELPSYPENLPLWDTLSPAQKDLEDLRMAVFAAMIEKMDEGIGRLIETLSETGELDNTFILFLSDNGTDSFSVLDEVMLRQNKLPGDRNSNWQLGTGWAYASVTPWRLYKISQHGGGITTGAVAYWPKGLKKGKRNINSTPLHVIDILPTLTDIAGVDPQKHEIKGESFYPVLKGKSFQRKDPLFFQFVDNRAVRTSEWTLAEVDNAGWELIRIKEDPLENKDLSSRYPEVVDSLSNIWLNWWKEQSGQSEYIPKSTSDSPHYAPQGDRGSGEYYVPAGRKKK